MNVSSKRTLIRPAREKRRTTLILWPAGLDEGGVLQERDHGRPAKKSRPSTAGGTAEFVHGPRPIPSTDPAGPFGPQMMLLRNDESIRQRGETRIECIQGRPAGHPEEMMMAALQPAHSSTTAPLACFATTCAHDDLCHMSFCLAGCPALWTLPRLGRRRLSGPSL
jgi:hypothetical protein